MLSLRVISQTRPLSSALASTFLSSNLLHYCLSGTKHSMAFLALSSKVLPNKSMVKFVTAVPKILVPTCFRITIAWWNIMTKRKLEKKELIWLLPPPHCSWLREIKTQAQTRPWTNLEAGADANVVEVFCLLVFSSWFARRAFSQNSGPPAQVRFQTQWTWPSSSISNKENALQAFHVLF